MPPTVQKWNQRALDTELAAHPCGPVLVDQDLHADRGSDLLEVERRSPSTAVVGGTGQAEAHPFVGALRRCTLDSPTPPTEPARIEATLAQLARTRANGGDVVLPRVAPRNLGGPGATIGRSRAMQPVFDMIRRVAPTDVSVLIQGESGTGKELVAQALHELSRREAAPLVAVNCGAIPESLVESELFGHEKGSFTGAHRLHRGCFERADGGTLFLDEIAEMLPQLQVKLLRVLETGLVQRIGGGAPIHVDVRIVAATNCEPEVAIRTGKLREDLYFRLAAFPIRLPPLRHRKGDVELMAEHFLDVQNLEQGTRKRWEAGALEQLALRPWRGNARELRNAVQRAFILADDVLHAEDACTGLVRTAPGARGAEVVTIPVGASIAELERTLICATLEQCAGDKAAAAGILGISVKTLYSRLSVYGASGS